jgi:hypothetical protein
MTTWQIRERVTITQILKQNNNLPILIHIRTSWNHDHEKRPLPFLLLLYSSHYTSCTINQVAEIYTCSAQPQHQHRLPYITISPDLALNQPSNLLSAQAFCKRYRACLSSCVYSLGVGIWSSTIHAKPRTLLQMTTTPPSAALVIVTRPSLMFCRADS